MARGRCPSMRGMSVIIDPNRVETDAPCCLCGLRDHADWPPPGYEAQVRAASQSFGVTVSGTATTLSFLSAIVAPAGTSQTYRLRGYD